MQKKLIALAVAGLVSAPVFAQSNVQIYGVVDAGFYNGKSGSNKFNGVESGLLSASRIGFRGTEDLGNGLKAKFVLEYGINTDTGSGPDGARQSFVGLEGGFGFVGLGRQYSPGHNFAGMLDVMGGSAAFNPYLDITSSTIANAGAGRWNNAISYKSPNFGGLTFEAMYAAGESSDQSNEFGNRKLGNLYEFADSVASKPLDQITRRDVLIYRDNLLARGQSATTATRKTGILKTLFGLAVEYEILDNNPAERVRGLPPPQRKPRVGFSVEDLRLIFDSSIYTKAYRPVGGGREACYWLPLLALFTGARVEELAQLLVGDVIEVPGLGHYLNISDEAEHAHLKNPASRRRIPLHATLVDCGFLEYLRALPQDGFLFPDLRVNPRGRRGGYFSNFFSGYLRRKIGIGDPRKVFHSFRHTFKDACRQAGIDEAVHDALTGHTTPNVGRRYGNEHYPLPPLFEAMQRYQLPELDLSHLRRASTGTHDEFPPAYGRVLCSAHGLLIRFCRPRNGAAGTPLLAIEHAAGKACMDVASNRVLAGVLTDSQKLLLHAWVELRKPALLENWVAHRAHGQFDSIAPLQ